MKKIFVLMASAAVLFAACNKMEEVDTPVETETITVVLNPVTKTSLDGKATLWTAGDKVSVTVGGKNIGTLALVEGSTFSGEVEAGHDGTATLNYPVDENGKAVTVVPSTQTAVAGSFANGAALLEGTTTMAKLRAGEGASLSNTTALLQFTVAQAGDVTFEVGTAKYTVTGCKTDGTYYACVAPASNVAFTARIDGYLSKKASSNVTFTANKIANLDKLPAPEKFGWGIVGQHQGWDITNPTPMYKVDNNVYAVLNIKLVNNGFKFAKNGLSNWDTANTYFGAWKEFAEPYVVTDWYQVYSNNLGDQTKNIGVSDWTKSYDVYIKVMQDQSWGQEFKYNVVNAGTQVTFP